MACPKGMGALRPARAAGTSSCLSGIQRWVHRCLPAFPLCPLRNSYQGGEVVQLNEKAEYAHVSVALPCEGWTHDGAFATAGLCTLMRVRTVTPCAPHLCRCHSSLHSAHHARRRVVVLCGWPRQGHVHAAVQGGCPGVTLLS